jgi:hypothetical protein
VFVTAIIFHPSLMIEARMKLTRVKPLLKLSFSHACKY